PRPWAALRNGFGGFPLGIASPTISCGDVKEGVPVSFTELCEGGYLLFAQEEQVFGLFSRPIQIKADGAQRGLSNSARVRLLAAVLCESPYQFLSNALCPDCARLD